MKVRFSDEVRFPNPARRKSPTPTWHTSRTSTSRAFDARSDEPGFHSVYRLADPETKSVFTGHLQIHAVELPYRSVARQDESDLLAWSKFLAADDDEEVLEACMTNAEVKRANKFLTHISSEAEAQELAEEREIAIKLHQYSLNVERTAGEASMLLRILRLRFGEVDEATVERVRAASESQLLEWADRVVDADSVDAVFQT